MRLLALLKTETADAHVALEQNLNLFEQVRTKEDYRQVLARFFTLHEPLEQRLASAADWTALGFDFAARRKASLARDDLRALGSSDAEIDAMPRAASLPDVGSIAGAVGCLYVLEGSTLGGQLIAKRFHETLGLTPESGAKFFRGYGTDTGPRWREFGQWAERQSAAADGDFDRQAVHAARDTFHSFAQWLKS